MAGVLKKAKYRSALTIMCMAKLRMIQGRLGEAEELLRAAHEVTMERLGWESLSTVAVAETVQAAQTQAPATEAIPSQAAPVDQADQAAAPDSDQPNIESELCTSCDDCILRNASLFAYDDVKQAYIKDPRAGSYREMVEAAENCPVCIIHPGKPLDPSEPNLDELQQRAASFN